MRCPNHRLCRAFCHNQRTGCNSIDFYKYICRKNIICIYQREHCPKQSIQHDKIQILFFRYNFLINKLTAAHYRQEHYHTERQCHQCLQRAGAQLIPPWRGKMPHHKGKGFSVLRYIQQQYRRKYHNNKYHRPVNFAGSPPVFHKRRDDAAEHCQKDAEERYIMYKIYMRHYSPSSSLESFMISSMFSVP